MGKARRGSCRAGRSGAFARRRRQTVRRSGGDGLVALFDLDGTLLDSWRAHCDAAAPALRSVGLGADPAQVRRFLVAHDAESAGLDQQVYLQAWTAMQPLYRRYQTSVRPFAGVGESLRTLVEAGVRIGLVTSKRRWAVEAELGRCRELPQFAAIVCREDTRRHKPQPEPLLLALRLLGEDRAVYVGDAPTDVQAARAATLPAVGVGWGWCGADALSAAGADAVCADPRELAPAIVRLGRRRSAS